MWRLIEARSKSRSARSTTTSASLARPTASAARRSRASSWHRLFRTGAPRSWTSPKETPGKQTSLPAATGSERRRLRHPAQRATARDWSAAAKERHCASAGVAASGQHRTAWQCQVHEAQVALAQRDAAATRGVGHLAVNTQRDLIMVDAAARDMARRAVGSDGADARVHQRRLVNRDDSGADAEIVPRAADGDIAEMIGDVLAQ